MKTSLNWLYICLQRTGNKVESRCFFMARKKVTVAGALSEYECIIAELSPETQIWYMRRLKRFAKWCAEKRLSVADLKPTHIAAYLQELHKPSVRTGKPLSSYTLH